MFSEGGDQGFYHPSIQRISVPAKERTAGMAGGRAAVWTKRHVLFKWMLVACSSAQGSAVRLGWEAALASGSFPAAPGDGYCEAFAGAGAPELCEAGPVSRPVCR